MLHNYQTILVAIDGSIEATHAFHKAIDIAKRNKGATLHLVHVIDTATIDSVDLYLQNIQEKALLLLADYKTEAIEEGVDNVIVTVEYGAPKSIIPKKVAPSIYADLIICGATGLNKVERLLFGSVSEAIVRHASCDVLIARTSEQ